MKKFLAIMLCLSISSCSVHQDITIPRMPCLYPYKDYDFILCQKFIYFVDHKKHVIPKYFKTDLASVPKILWSFYSPNAANTIPAAIIHDYLYFCPDRMPRKKADSIFYDALIANGTSMYTAFKYWLAVRIFGASHFSSGNICDYSHPRTTNPDGDL